MCYTSASKDTATNEPKTAVQADYHYYCSHFFYSRAFNLPLGPNAAPATDSDKQDIAHIKVLKVGQ